MAGHSKWANIRFRKSVQDAKRGKLFTKFIREITTAARHGGGDPDTNPRLRTAIDKALSANMTRDTIDRAIKRGAGNNEGDMMEEVRYEGYGPGGVAIMVDCLTDNRNRTVSEVRHAFTKSGGNLGTDGSVSYLFSHVGLLSFLPGVDENRLMESALENGADDIQTDSDGNVEVQTSVQHFHAIKDGLQKVGLIPERAELTYVASTSVTLDKELAERLMKLIDALEDLDDVQNVYSNADISEDIVTALS